MFPSARSTDTKCVFCDIVAGRSQAWIVFEDAHTMAFLDIFPFTRGHLLVIPKRHGARLTDIPFDEQMGLIRSLDEICRRVETRFTPHYNVAMNTGANAGQIVMHVHFHVIPRYGEGNPFQIATRAPLTESDAREVVAELAPP
jgi:histidine triad (HIT) family protein